VVSKVHFQPGPVARFVANHGDLKPSAMPESALRGDSPPPVPPVVPLLYVKRKRPRQGPQFGQAARDSFARLATTRVSPWTQPFPTWPELNSVPDGAPNCSIRGCVYGGKGGPSGPRLSPTVWGGPPTVTCWALPIRREVDATKRSLWLRVLWPS